MSVAVPRAPLGPLSAIYCQAWQEGVQAMSGRSRLFYTCGATGGFPNCPHHGTWSPLCDLVSGLCPPTCTLAWRLRLEVVWEDLSAPLVVCLVVSSLMAQSLSAGLVLEIPLRLDGMPTGSDGLYCGGDFPHQRCG